MFEIWRAYFHYIIYAEKCQAKFDFVKNLTIGPGKSRTGPGAVDDNIIIATYNPKKEWGYTPLNR